MTGPACRVCATVIVYDPDLSHVGIGQLFDSTEAAGTTDYAIGVDQKSAAGTADWIRERLRDATVFEFEWQDDFAYARNLALDRVPAGCDWSYWIDSDDVLEATAGSNLPEFLASLPPEVGMVWVPYIRRCPSGAIAGEVNREVFYRTSVVARWQDAVHETWACPPDTVECSTRVFRRRHEGVDDDRSHSDRNLRILTHMLESEPNRPRTWSLIATEHAFAGRWRDAVQAYSEAIRLSPAYLEAYSEAIRSPSASPVYSEAWLRSVALPAVEEDAVLSAVKGAYAALIAGDLDQAVQMVGVAMRMRPKWPESLFVQGQLRYWLGDFRGACESLEASLAVFATDGAGIPPWKPTSAYSYRTEPHLLLVAAYCELGEVEPAVKHVEAALASSGPAPWLMTRLIEMRAALRAGLPSQALEIWLRA